MQKSETRNQKAEIQGRSQKAEAKGQNRGRAIEGSSGERVGCKMQDGRGQK
jgi:hypothetical protein